MALTKAQTSALQNVISAGGGKLGVGLNEEQCNFLVFTIVRDLGLIEKFPDFPKKLPGFFEPIDPWDQKVTEANFDEIIEQLYDCEPDADTYFISLATLQKSRLKYSRILEYQPLPTMDQVGPRSLLQFGQMNTRALATFLFWRKWIFDIDNRAGQETGYLFEPIIANSIGGRSFSSRSSPVIRHDNENKRRQVDCILKNFAYEFKIRLTIAASGQGRWNEELSFPIDCKKSGFVPVLIVLDPTPNPKLEELVAAFKGNGGKAYIGDDAWDHLETVAGKTMTIFLENYVRNPIDLVLNESPDVLPDIAFSMQSDEFTLKVEDEVTTFKRAIGPETSPNEV